MWINRSWNVATIAFGQQMLVGRVGLCWGLPTVDWEKKGTSLFKWISCDVMGVRVLENNKFVWRSEGAGAGEGSARVNLWYVWEAGSPPSARPTRLPPSHTADPPPAPLEYRPRTPPTLALRMLLTSCRMCSVALMVGDDTAVDARLP